MQLDTFKTQVRNKFLSSLSNWRITVAFAALLLIGLFKNTNVVVVGISCFHYLDCGMVNISCSCSVESSGW